MTSQAILGAGTTAIVAPVATPALTPELVLPYLAELSTDIRAAVLLGADGSEAAAQPEAQGDRLRELTLELFEQADGADDQPVGQVEISTGDGAVYALREDGWTVSVVTGRFALPALMFYDLRSALAALGTGTR